MTVDQESEGHVKVWRDAAGIEHEGAVLSTTDGADVIECMHCGFRHIVPMPKAEDLRRFYEEEFYQSERAHYIPASEQDREWRQSEFLDRFEVAETNLGPSTSQRRVLDIGCGPGDFVAVGHDKGWDSVGVEPSPMAAKFAADRGLTIVNDFFDRNVANTLGQFDFIHMSEVLEHIPNPVEILEAAERILAPGGILCISVPNDYNAFQKVATENYECDEWWVTPSHHINYFDFESLECVVAKLGLKPFSRSTNFPMELFLLMGQNYIGNREEGSRLHAMRKAFDMSLTGEKLSIRSKFYKALAEADLGRLAIVFAQKAKAG